MVTAEPMSPVDTTWLRMDQPANPMVITGVLMLQGPVDLDRLERVIAARLLALPRFHQCVAARAVGYWWAPDPYFSINRHIKRLRLPGRGGKAELQRFVADLASQQLDMAHPLWEFHIVEKCMGGAAVVARIHHAIADGIALIGVMLSLTDSEPGEEGAAPEHAFHAGETRQGSAWRDVLRTAEAIGRRGLQLSQQVLQEARARATGPAQTVREGANIAGELGWLLFMPQDSPTRFKGKPRGQKRVAWTDPLALPEVKVVSRMLGCSVNDMLLAAVAGSLGAYLAAKGDPTHGVEVRALVPVNLRGKEATLQLGNQFGIVALELPVGIENPLARLYEIRRRMEALKHSYKAPVTLGLISRARLRPAPGAGSPVRPAAQPRECGHDRRARTAASALSRRLPPQAGDVLGSRTGRDRRWAFRSCPSTGSAVRRDDRCRGDPHPRLSFPHSARSSRSCSITC